MDQKVNTNTTKGAKNHTEEENRVLALEKATATTGDKKLTEEQKRSVAMAAATLAAGIVSTLRADQQTTEALPWFNIAFNHIKAKVLSE